MPQLHPGLNLLSGAALAVPVGLNNGFREGMDHPVPATLTSFTTGTPDLFVFVPVLRPARPIARDAVRDARFESPGPGVSPS